MFKSSAIYKIYVMIITIWNGSFLHKLMFGNFGVEDGIKDSRIGKIIGGITGFFDRAGGKNSEIVAKSKIIGFFASVLNDLLFVSVRSYGVCFVIFGAITAAVKYFIFGTTDLLFYGATAFLIVGIILIILNRSIAGLYNGSYLKQLVGGFFGLEKLSEKETEKSHILFFAAIGVFLGLSAAFLSMEMFILAVGGVIGGLLVLYRTETGVFATAFLIPLVPTKLVLGMTLITFVSYVLHVLAGRLKFRFSLMDFFVFTFAFCVIVSVFTSFRPLGSAPVAAVYLLFIAFYIAVKNTLTSKKQVFAIVSVIVLSGVIVAVIGIYQRMTGSYADVEMWLDADMFEGVGARIYSTLENPNVLGEYLIIIISLALGMLYYFKQPIYKLSALAIIGLTGMCMAFTLSRGAWVGLIFAVVVFIMLSDRRLIWLGIIAVILAPLILPRSMVERFLSIGNIQDTSTNYRLNIWLASLLMLKIFWPSGIGLGLPSFVFVYSIFAFNAVYAPHSHNLFLQIAIDLGIAGFVAFAGMIIMFFKKLFMAQKTAGKGDKLTKILPGALCAALAGYLLQGMTDNVWYNYRIVCLFWLLLAVAGSAALGGMKNDSKLQ